MARAYATDSLCMMTGAKHRVRSTRGARGSNPSQKTPRQRSARKRAFYALLAQPFGLCEKGVGLGVRLCFLMARTFYARSA